MVNLHSTLEPVTDVAFREINREGVLLDLGSGAYFGLNGSGTRAWQLLLAGESLASIHAQLLREYDVDPAVLERDLVAWAERLVERGLLRAS